MIRNRADTWPVLLIVALSILDLGLYLFVDQVWWLIPYLLIMIIPKACIAAWNHHHQHTRTFHWAIPNRILEVLYALHTGVTTNLWLLHHVLGHHHNYQDQTQDESRWQRRDGSQMGIFEYTFTVAVTAYYRGYLVGRRYPAIYRIHLSYTLLTFAVVALLVWYQPIQALILFVLPMVTTLFVTAWATYDHHAGLDESDDPFKASYNITNPLFNRITGNLGYHTAHHYRQGLHWSQLPRLHREIQHEIPSDLYIEPFWTLFYRYVLRAMPWVR